MTVPAAAQPLDVAVSHRARGLFPGEAVLLRVEASGSLTEVHATAFDETVRFYQAADGVWHGLVGIDLLVEPGDHDVALRIRPVTGVAIARVYTLSIEHKAYQTRQLTVAPRYVEPPPEVGERIAREARQQAAIFVTATEARLWRGSWGRPVAGQATSAFGSRSVFNGQPRSPHSGADFRAAEGTPVTAPNVGNVVLTGTPTSQAARSSLTMAGGSTPTSPICRRSSSRKGIWSSLVRWSVTPEQPAGSPVRICTGPSG